MTTKRKSTGKRLRFEIFARDGFRCRYCGRQSDEVKLVIDHIEPVINGGSSEPENLITACEPCNQGKAARVISQFVPTDNDRLRREQELREQKSALATAKEAKKTRQEKAQMICDEFCAAVGIDSMRKSNIGLIAFYLERYGPVVMEWVEIAGARFTSERKAMRYLCGIRRRWCSERPEFAGDVSERDEEAA